MRECSGSYGSGVCVCTGGFGCRSQCIERVEDIEGGGNTRAPLATESWAGACGFV